MFGDGLELILFSISAWDGIFFGVGSLMIVVGSVVVFTGKVVKFLLGVKGCGWSFFRWPWLSNCWVTSLTLLSELESKSSKYVSSALGNTLFRYLMTKLTMCLVISHSLAVSNVAQQRLVRVISIKVACFDILFLFCFFFKRNFPAHELW